VSAAQAQPPAPSTEPETHPAPTTPLTTGNPFTENRFRRHRVQQSLTRPLRPDELIEHGRRLAAIHGELDGIDVELAGAKADAKQRSGVLEGEASDLARDLRAGTVLIDVEVEVELDYVDRKARYTRLDTGEAYRERPLSYDEAQLEIRLG